MPAAAAGSCPALVTHSGPQRSRNPALQRAPNALQNGTSLLGRPPGIPRHQPRRSCRIFKGLHSALCGYRRKIFVEA
jgi:hypothetical protein